MNRGLFVHGGSFMKKYFAIALGAFLIALGAAHFAEPAGLVTGGAAGIAIIVERIAKVPLFITTLFVNIPLFAAAGRKMGFKFLSSSLLASALYTVFLGVLENVPHLIIDDILVSAAVSGVLTGAGLGITIKSGATTGGTDMLAMLIKNYKPHIKPSTVINITDGGIILAGAALLGAELLRDTFSRGVHLCDDENFGGRLCGKGCPDNHGEGRKDRREHQFLFRARRNIYSRSRSVQKRERNSCLYSCE